MTPAGIRAPSRWLTVPELDYAPISPLADMT